MLTLWGRAAAYLQHRQRVPRESKLLQAELLRPAVERLQPVVFSVLAASSLVTQAAAAAKADPISDVELVVRAEEVECPVPGHTVTKIQYGKETVLYQKAQLAPQPCMSTRGGLPSPPTLLHVFMSTPAATRTMLCCRGVLHSINSSRSASLSMPSSVLTQMRVKAQDLAAPATIISASGVSIFAPHWPMAAIHESISPREDAAK